MDDKAKEMNDEARTFTLPSGVFDVGGQKFKGPGTVIVQGGKVVGGTAAPAKRWCQVFSSRNTYQWRPTHE